MLDQKGFPMVSRHYRKRNETHLRYGTADICCGEIFFR